MIIQWNQENILYRSKCNKILGVLHHFRLRCFPLSGNVMFFRNFSWCDWASNSTKVVRVIKLLLTFWSRALISVTLVGSGHFWTNPASRWMCQKYKMRLKKEENSSKTHSIQLKSFFHETWRSLWIEEEAKFGGCCIDLSEGKGTKINSSQTLQKASWYEEEWSSWPELKGTL